MKKVLLLIVCSLFGLQIAKAQLAVDSLNKHYAIGAKAHAQGNYLLFVQSMERCLQILPGNASLLYNMAMGYALLNDYTNTTAYLNQLCAEGKVIANRAVSDSLFANLWSQPQWAELHPKLEQLVAYKGSSTLVATISEPDLIPEGIAVNPKTGDIYLSSLYKSKVVKVDAAGNVSDFVLERSHELGPTIGMKVDVARNRLWVVSSVQGLNNRLDSTMLGMSGLFAFDLTTANLVYKHLLPPAEGHFLNDLDIASDGTIYVSDSKFRAVYKADKGEAPLVKLVDLPNNYYPNGIALSADESKLYVAGTTVEVITLSTLAVTPLKAPSNVVVSGDGLYLYNGTLIAVQNTDLNRIAQFTLSSSGYEVTSVKVLEANHPEWIIPTTGSIYSGKLYYIANSQLRAFQPNGSVLPLEQLKPVYVRAIALE